MKQSQVSIGIVDYRGDLQGFARVITDFILKAMIFDVIVSNKYRDEELGGLLLQAIQEHPVLRNVKQFELYCLPELESYHDRFGFLMNLGGIRLMRK